MGLGMPYLRYLSAKGHLGKRGARILDIGSQCLLGATGDEIRRFVERHGGSVSRDKLLKEAERIAYFSTPRAGERTSYLSELIDLTEFEYTSYDVCPALKTEIFDLNRQSLPRTYRGHFDVVLNFGTTEHIINQLNCFKVMHEALAVGGVAMHQLPSTGWINHGYFCYHLPLFKDLCGSNDYDLLDHWYTPTGASKLPRTDVDVRAAEAPELPHSTDPNDEWRRVPGYLINIVMRKRSDKPFTLPLELATAHASLAQGVDTTSAADVASGTQPQTAASAQAIDLSRIAGRTMARELVKRLARRITGGVLGD